MTFSIFPIPMSLMKKVFTLFLILSSFCFSTKIQLNESCLHALKEVALSYDFRDGYTNYIKGWLGESGMEAISDAYENLKSNKAFRVQYSSEFYFLLSGIIENYLRAGTTYDYLIPIYQASSAFFIYITVYNKFDIDDDQLVLQIYDYLTNLFKDIKKTELISEVQADLDKLPLFRE